MEFAGTGASWLMDGEWRVPRAVAVGLGFVGLGWFGLWAEGGLGFLDGRGVMPARCSAVQEGAERK